MVIVVGTRQSKRAPNNLECPSHIMWSHALGDSNSIKETFHTTAAKDNFESEIYIFFPYTMIRKYGLIVSVFFFFFGWNDCVNLEVSKLAN